MGAEHPDSPESQALKSQAQFSLSYDVYEYGSGAASEGEKAALKARILAEIEAQSEFAGGRARAHCTQGARAPARSPTAWLTVPPPLSPQPCA